MRPVSGELTLKLVPWNIITNNNRIHHKPPFFLQPYRMAEGVGSKIAATNPTIESNLRDKPPEQPPKEIPSPPEKPLPGDCCGSGCVRCVWDVYYEELEEYNKLYKPDPKPKS